MKVVDAKRMIISADATLYDALKAIDEAGVQITALVGPGDRLVAVMTDGDVRRALLRGFALTDPALPHANPNPVTVEATGSRARTIDLLRALKINSIPVVDAGGQVVGVHTSTGMLGHEVLSNHALIIAGGKGTRLGAVTKGIPKPLLRIADRPIIEWILLQLIDSGIETFHVSVAYLKEQIMDFLGDGSHYNVAIDYVVEDPDVPLGTAGALALLHEQSPVMEPLLVTNADLMARYDASDLVAHHVESGNALTVATRQYTHVVPFGVLGLDASGHLRRWVEKPTLEYPISAGVYMVSPDVVERCRPGVPLNMPDIVTDCLARDETVGHWPIPGDWIDVGTPNDLLRAKGLA